MSPRLDKENITEEILISFVDGELNRHMNDQVAEIVSKDPELQKYVEKQKMLSSDLKKLFDVKEDFKLFNWQPSDKTPDHIEQKIDELALKLDENNNHQNSNKNKNVISFNFIKKTKERMNVSFNSLIQIAAAFAIGLYISPNLLPKTGSDQFVMRGGNDGSAIESSNHFSLTISQLGKVIQAEVGILSKTPFTISIVSPITGTVDLQQIEGNQTNKILVDKKNILKGQNIVLVEGTVDPFQPILKFKVTLSNSKIQISTDFKIKVREE